MMPVVVTGAASALGRAVCIRLRDAGAPVVAVHDADQPAPPDTPDCVPIDLSNEAAVEALARAIPPQASIVHLAQSCGFELDDLAQAPESRVFDYDILGALRVLDAARQSQGLRSVVAISTHHVYEPVPPPRWLDEADATEPTSPYGIVKLALENHAFAFAEEARVPVTLLRLAPLYGTPAAPDAPLDTARSCQAIHVEDVARCVELAVTSRRSRCYNVAEPKLVGRFAATWQPVKSIGHRDDHSDPRRESAHAQAPAAMAVDNQVVMRCDRIRQELGFVPQRCLRSAADSAKRGAKR